MTSTGQATSALLVIACSGRKLDTPARAIDLYRGVLYGTYRANVGDKPPHVIILSALHGFIPGDTVIEPYEQMMTNERADDIVSQLACFEVNPQPWPQTDNVMLAGSTLYRRVMGAAIDRQRLSGIDLPNARQTVGGIGMQRQQLGQWLRAFTHRDTGNGSDKHGSDKSDVDAPAAMRFGRSVDATARKPEWSRLSDRVY